MRRAAALAAVLTAVVAAAGCTEPKPRPGPAPTPSSAVGPATVTPGAFCDEEGAEGVTENGTGMECRRHEGEDRPRWRSA